MDWKPVESSQISEIGYEPETTTLGVRFKGKGIYPATEYHYHDVSALIYAELMSAESVGSFFHQHIKTHAELFPYTRVM